MNEKDHPKKIRAVVRRQTCAIGEIEKPQKHWERPHGNGKEENAYRDIFLIPTPGDEGSQGNGHNDGERGKQGERGNLLGFPLPKVFVVIRPHALLDTDKQRVNTTCQKKHNPRAIG